MTREVLHWGVAKLTLSTGSNLGDRSRTLGEALRRLSGAFGPPDFVSPTVETPAWGNTDQPDFLNQVSVFSLHLRLEGEAIRNELHRILEVTQEIEAGLGRRREVRWAARTIDIDLIFLDDIVYEDERVSLPHPWWRHRPFVFDLIPRDLRSGRRYFR